MPSPVHTDNSDFNFHSSNFNPHNSSAPLLQTNCIHASNSVSSVALCADSSDPVDPSDPGIPSNNSTSALSAPLREISSSLLTLHFVILDSPLVILPLPASDRSTQCKIANDTNALSPPPRRDVIPVDFQDSVGDDASMQRAGFETDDHSAHTSH